MPGEGEINDILMDLMFQVDTENPVTKEVTLKLNEVADVVAAGLPDVRQTALDLGAYAIVCRAWIYCCYSGSNSNNSLAPGAKQCRNAVLKALIALTPGNPDIIDDVGWQIIMQAVDKTLPESTLMLVLKLLRNIFIKSEDNREQFCWNLDMLESLLSLVDRPKVTNPFLTEWCSALKALVLNDDIQEIVNRASERKRAIASARILPSLASRLIHHTEEENEAEVQAMNSIVILLTSMAVNEELCLSIEQGNCLLGIHNLFRRHTNNKYLMRNTIALLRYLCVCQQVRDKASTFALMKHVIDIVNLHQKNKGIVETAMHCLAYMTLKSPCHVAQLIVKGGLQTIMEIMTSYGNNVTVLKSACLTLRNVNEYGEDGKDKMKEMGFTMFLNNLLSTCLQLNQLYIGPLLRELGYSSTSFLEEHAQFQGEHEVPFEPKAARKSVLVDEQK